MSVECFIKSNYKNYSFKILRYCDNGFMLIFGVEILLKVNYIS